MNPIALLLLLSASIATFLAPRKWAALPLIAVACYTTKGSGIEIASLNFSPIRIIVIIAFLRTRLKGEHIINGTNKLDYLIFGWAITSLATSFFHENAGSEFIYRAGNLFDTVGSYLCIRIFCSYAEDIITLIRSIAIILAPLAIEMVQEHQTGYNSFSILGGVSPNVLVRNGTLRASGPFLHAILAGTVGGVCFPLMFAIYKTNKKTFIIGCTACFLIVMSSASSGPLMAFIFGILAMYLWRHPDWVKLIFRGSVLAYLALTVVMTRPAYYIISMIDLTGSSTGWHRAALINSSIRHLSEWYLYGTDYTRHWMPTGVSWNENHTDITNHYIAQGVAGGLILFIIYTLSIIIAFRYASKILKNPAIDDNARLVTWALGASLFSHAASTISVAYFDQSVLFLYFTLAAISSLYSFSKTQTAEDTLQQKTS